MAPWTPKFVLLALLWGGILIVAFVLIVVGAQAVTEFSSGF